MVLPLDAEDASETSQMERVERAFLSPVGGPSFAAVEQLAENAYLVDVHFGVLSQVFFPLVFSYYSRTSGSSLAASSRSYSF